jgi:3alpha(or 20beta)-hydroxysteroid dehydrogenase
MSGRLQGSVVLVTGAARGQGAADVRLFVREGASVVLADVLADEGDALARELGEQAEFVVMDVRDEQAWKAAVETTLERFGRLTALVNNAGIMWKRPLLEETLEGLDEILAVNLRGAFLGVRTCAPAIAAAGGGAIVNVSSTAGMVGYSGRAAYAMSKWGLRGLTRVAAIELAPLGIRVNALLPGGVNTSMATSPDDPVHWANLPAGRIGEVAELAEAALFLISSGCSYMTGADLVVDGGALAGA